MRGLTKSQMLTLAGVVVSQVAGGYLVYAVTKKKFEREYDERLTRELETSVAFLTKQFNLDKPVIISDDPENVGEPTPIDEKLMGEHDAIAETYGQRVFTGQDKPPLEDIVARNETTQYNTPVNPVEEPEEDLSGEEEPYQDPDVSVIGRDLFMENTSEWTQDTLTYFADDGVLDVGGDFVEDHVNLIGPNKPPFGQMSEDANVVYLRNKRIQREFEVIFDPGNASDFLAHSLQDLYQPSRRL